MTARIANRLPAAPARTPRFALAAVACLGAVASTGIVSADTVTYSPAMPAFTQPNDFLFTSATTLSIPCFDTLGGALVLERATFTWACPSLTYTYDMTNNGTTTASALLNRRNEGEFIGPGGVVIFGPPYGGGGGGPPAAPGQTVTNTNQVTGVGRSKTVSTTSALPFTGSGNYDINAAISFPITIQNPEQFSAVYITSQFSDPTFEVIYTFRCDGDTNDDHLINIDDLLTVISNWGSFDDCFPQNHCPADIAPTPQTDYFVDIDDLLRVIGRWGECPIK